MGCYVTLTNSYTLVSYSVMRHDLYDIFNNVVECSVDNGNKMIGRMTVGNSKGLLVPSSTSEEEMNQLRNNLPTNVKIAQVNDVLTALGNCIVCNDFVALLHPGLSDETEEII